ncbi:MAG TPA: RluA family pseudouridine synthase [Polyangiaceae bacterium]
MPKSAEPGFRDGTHEIAADAPLDRALRTLVAGASWNAVRRLIETGKVSVDGEQIRDPTRPVRGGSTLTIAMRAPRQRTGAGLPAGSIVHLDAHVVVVRKPAGISSVPFDERETGTLVELLRAELRGKSGPEAPPGVVHRLDKDTSGLLVFSRTLAAKRALKQQFRFHTVDRRYVAIAHGNVRAQTFRSRLVQDRGDGRRGSTENPILGRDSVTHVSVRERLREATLVECRLETGRTHQIRIHLAEAGHPLVGERVYDRAYTGPRLEAPRLMLHAFELGFEHPATGQRLHFEDPIPDDFSNVVERLRGEK